jgi:hypothetical protein
MSAAPPALQRGWDRGSRPVARPWGIIDPSQLLRERQIGFNPLYIGGMDHDRLRQLPLALGILARHKMAAGRV